MARVKKMVNEHIKKEIAKYAQENDVTQKEAAEILLETFQGLEMKTSAEHVDNFLYNMKLE